MTPIRLVHHAPGAPGLRWLGLGPDLRPSRALLKLQRLFDRHAFWARGRSFSQLRRLLAGSDAVVSPLAWQATGGLRPGYLRWLQPGCAVGHRGGRRPAGPWIRTTGDRRTAAHHTCRGRRAGISNDYQECWLLQAAGLPGCEPTAADGASPLKRF